MKDHSPEIRAARDLAEQAASKLQQSAAFRQLDAATQLSLLLDLEKIRRTFTQTSGAVPAASDPYAFALETPEDFTRRRSHFQRGGEQQMPAQEPATTEGNAPAPRRAATETLAERAGALIDEIDFPAFVAGLVHGTFDAIVDASIRQMEAFADLVSAVAKNVDDFTRDNVSANQARDWLAQRYARDVQLNLNGPEPRLQVRSNSGDEFREPPEWLSEFGLAGEEFSNALLEERLVPEARRRIGESRMQMLATMVLMGMNRINVKDGSISARVRFRAAASDRAQVDYAVSQDPATNSAWGRRGSANYAQHATMISTVGVNAQTDTDLKAELFGNVEINFVSETLPLERFVDQAQMALLQRNARQLPKLGSNGTTANRQAPVSEDTAQQPVQGQINAPTTAPTEGSA
ncbi:MAG: hypothetical protein DKINENOH_04856 [bacterium]|nr:hypothetical protein [bacterium]